MKCLAWLTFNLFSLTVFLNHVLIRRKELNERSIVLVVQGCESNISSAFLIAGKKNSLFFKTSMMSGVFCTSTF